MLSCGAFRWCFCAGHLGCSSIDRGLDLQAAVCRFSVDKVSRGFCSQSRGLLDIVSFVLLIMYSCVRLLHSFVHAVVNVYGFSGLVFLCAVVVKFRACGCSV